MKKIFTILVCLFVLAFGYAGTAVNVGGLYYTGLDSSGQLQSGGSQDSNWNVTYAYVNGTRYKKTSTYTGNAYVLDPNYIDSAYIQNTTSAQWITAPGAMTSMSGGTSDIGGDYLPGNGTSGTNKSFYVYQLIFTVYGTGTGTITNNVSISLNLAADDNYSIYVTSTPVAVTRGGKIHVQNPSSVSGTSAWSNSTTQVLSNGYGGNTVFSIGSNYLTVIVENSNSVNGNSSNTNLNPSGLLVYQVGSVATIDGRPVPEVGTWIPLVMSLGLFGVVWFRRNKKK